MKSCPPHLLLLSSPPLPPMARESETTKVLSPTSSNPKSSCTPSSRPLLLTLVSLGMNSGRLNAFLSYDIAVAGKPRQPRFISLCNLHQALEVGDAGSVAKKSLKLAVAPMSARVFQFPDSIAFRIAPTK